MKEDVDPRIDRMMAFLYGELPPAEERAFRRMLEGDAALRAELEELGEMRGTLAGWKVEEHVPSFVLVDQGAPARSRRQGQDANAWTRLLETIRSFGAAPAWGFAAATLLLFVLAGSGFRVERVAGGIAFRMGERGAPVTPDTPSTVAEDPLHGLGDGEPLELASSRGRDAAPGPAPASTSGPYLTREEFDAYNAQLLSTLAALLNDYDVRRDHETAEVMQGLYRRINEQQVFDYERVTRRIDALGLQLAVDRGQDLGVPLGATRPSDNESVPGRTAGEE